MPLCQLNYKAYEIADIDPVLHITAFAKLEKLFSHPNLTMLVSASP